MRILVIKTSSLGDVLQTLPAVSDAKRARPDLTVDWLVEEAFAPAPAWHPGVADVIPVALRRWRKRPEMRQIRASVGRLRNRRYDLVIDAQGLAKSAALALLARGPSAGFDSRSAREAAASLVYSHRISVPRDLHAVDRVRQLFAGALGYALPNTPPDYGLARPARPARARLLLLHGATWTTKRWPENYWSDLARRAIGAGIEPVLRWHDQAERASAERIAAAAPGTGILPAEGLEALRQVISGASMVAANDSGPAHLAAALGVPSVTFYGSTQPAHNGTLGPDQIHLAADFPCSPCRNRICTYRGPAAVEPACYSTIPPERVWREIERLIGR
jgi:heptosyltransferase-1